MGGAFFSKPLPARVLAEWIMDSGPLNSSSLNFIGAPGGICGISTCGVVRLSILKEFSTSLIFLSSLSLKHPSPESQDKCTDRYLELSGRIHADGGGAT